uniref:Light-independent protochlorophyllide reductase subunit B n=1 Tax=Cyanophora paradoxa TaxID=2762 RepID=CHLB_CYAPA|nr:photochlorophyllide reductase subunit B [Cyanophora paradoxa]P48099.1 RecName: Full=Light-independent protochlorophyllide reductase subunit B; Short=DPOR subunit B; Short=LI-POR subunit B [Cyanophora paradoxa]AAA81180.1 subunit of protochlorophyllide reductase [Cyanophora paradoxa]
MKLAYWMYTGPAHIGTLRIASSFKNVHAIMHAPLGDDYFNVMRSMLERERNYTPVTTSVVDRNVLARGSQEKVIDNILRKDKEEQPDLIVLTPTCTSSILQEDLQNFVEQASLNSMADVLLADVNHYRINELQACDKTLEQIVRFYIEKNRASLTLEKVKTLLPSVNLIGISSLGFHNNHDTRELKKLFELYEIILNCSLPQGTTVKTLINLPKAWLNILPYRELGLLTSKYLNKEFGLLSLVILPMGNINLNRFLKKLLFSLKLENNTITKVINIKLLKLLNLNWIKKEAIKSKLKRKKAIIFGSSNHVATLTKLLSKEIGLEIILCGTYCKSESKWFSEQVQNYCNKILITEDHTMISNEISKLKPDVIFGTQMERHIGKRLGIPCGVISSPIHIQNFPLSYKPMVGYEGVKTIMDLLFNSLNLKDRKNSFTLFNEII